MQEGDFKVTGPVMASAHGKPTKGTADTLTRLSAIVAKARANSVERRENEEKSRTGLSSPSVSPPMGEREANLWVAMHEDPSNLRVIIKGQVYELRSHQCDALLELRAGKKTKSLSLDEDNRLWYDPPPHHPNTNPDPNLN